MRGHQDSATKSNVRDNNQHNIQCLYNIVWFSNLTVEYAFNKASYLVGPKQDVYISLRIYSSRSGYNDSID